MWEVIQRSGSRLFQFCAYMFHIHTSMQGQRKAVRIAQRGRKVWEVNGDLQEANPAMIVCTLTDVSTLTFGTFPW